MSAPEKSNLKYSAKGRSWVILIRGPRGMAFDRLLVKYTGFSLVTLQFALAGGHRYTPTLLLTSVGARSRQLREAALPYVRLGRDQDELVLVGSKGGGPVDPAWVANVRKNPLCWVHVRRKQYAVTAHIPTGQERADLYDHLLGIRPNLGHYQARADTFGREIPLVVLRRIAKETT